MRVGMQLFTHDLGPLGNYRTRFDWFYLDYRFWDWLGVRAGRTKLPFGLYNESSDIDAARVPVLLPQSVYPVSNRDFLARADRRRSLRHRALGRAGSLEYRLYGGTVFYDTADATSTLSNVRVPVHFRRPADVANTRSKACSSARAPRSCASMRTRVFPRPRSRSCKWPAQLPSDFSGPIKLQMPALLAVASIEYSAHDLLLASEYSRWRVSHREPGRVCTPSQKR